MGQMVKNHMLAEGKVVPRCFQKISYTVVFSILGLYIELLPDLRYRAVLLQLSDEGGTSAPSRNQEERRPWSLGRQVHRYPGEEFKIPCGYRWVFPKFSFSPVAMSSPPEMKKHNKRTLLFLIGAIFSSALLTKLPTSQSPTTILSVFVQAPLLGSVLTTLSALTPTISLREIDINKEIDGRSPIHYAADYGQHDVIQYLISKGADVNLWLVEGRAALMHVQMAQLHSAT
uniref:Uncharacterized protein n=1 Tax=Timema douglasi TaxID=61478 RepID=A0A7R8VBV1_TIMDO|nr:unnamed protein product [Timema douglasi]